MKEIVLLDHVCKRFGAIDAVYDVSISLDAGETVALVGHNGAGKTTLMKMMLGLLRPSSGWVSVLGADPSDGHAAVRQRIGFLPEHVAFNAAMTGRETLGFYARLKQQQKADVERLLDTVGLVEAADRRVGSYSKGMRQRLGLAQALLGDPRLLLLDEPTTGLDPALRQLFYEIVDRMRRAGAAILLASHALDELQDRASRIVILHRGAKRADGTLDSLREVARLGTLVRVTLDDTEPLAPWAEKHGGRRLNARQLEFVASPEEKIDVVKRLVCEWGATDIEVIPPSLDQLYAHFLLEGGGP